MPNSSELITCDKLSKSYGDLTALESLSFALSPNEIIGILGPNGAGKTTTLHMILGLLTPTSGEVSVMGLSPDKDHHEISQHINFSSAYSSLPHNLSVIENLEIFARIYGLKNGAKKIDGLLEKFEISYLKKRITGALSSGESTRLNLVRSLLNDPSLLILDEPTASLDPDMADKVRKILKAMQAENQMGILYTSHNMYEVEEICDRIIFIHHGKVMAEGTSESVSKDLAAGSLEQAFIKMVRSGDIISGKDD